MKKIALLAVSLSGAALLAVAGVGVASAATNSQAKNNNVGSSGIPRSTFKAERLNAAAQVLNTTTDNITAAHKNKTMSQLLSKAGLTKKTYAQKLKAQLTSDLQNEGYNQDQIMIALQHRQIVHLRSNKQK